jgi:purine catabolism regulator
MAMTVHRLTQDPVLGLRLIAGRENADRSITWAHPIELRDPTPYLAGGELVMTTGMGVGRTADEQFDYVRRLSAAGTAALAFDTGITFTQVPQGIIAAGDDLGMPIVEVPAATPFIAITRAVIDEVTADQLREVEWLVGQQETMARQALRHGIPAVVTSLSKALTASVVVVGADCNVLAGSGPDTDRISDLVAGVIRRSATRGSGKHTSRVIADGDGYCTLQALRITQTLQGYLAVRTGQPLTTSQRLLVSHAVSLIAIELDKPARVLDAEQRLRAAAARALLNQPQMMDHGVLRYFGFEPDAPVVVAVLTNVGPVLKAEDHARHAAMRRGHPFLLCALDDDIVVVLPADIAADAHQIHGELGAQLQRAIGAGLSESHRISDVVIALHQARMAASSVRSIPGGVRRFSELDLFGMILGSRSSGELELIARRLISIEESDLQNPGDAGLVGTLCAFLRHNGHMESAAGELAIHRHTMRTRLRKIRDLMECDLDDADIRAELWLAIRARQRLAIGA